MQKIYKQIYGGWNIWNILRNLIMIIRWGKNKLFSLNMCQCLFDTSSLEF
jgi:hypothetical protein